MQRKQASERNREKASRSLAPGTPQTVGFLLVPGMASNGVAIIPDCGTSTEREADMVFVCAGGNPAIFDDRSVFAWLRRLARKGVTIGGISGGPYVLAKAGLLDERRAPLPL